MGCNKCTKEHDDEGHKGPGSFFALNLLVDGPMERMADVSVTPRGSGALPSRVVLCWLKCEWRRLWKIGLGAVRGWAGSGTRVAPTRHSDLRIAFQAPAGDARQTTCCTAIRGRRERSGCAPCRCRRSGQILQRLDGAANRIFQRRHSLAAHKHHQRAVFVQPAHARQPAQFPHEWVNFRSAATHSSTDGGNRYAVSRSTGTNRLIGSPYCLDCHDCVGWRHRPEDCKARRTPRAPPRSRCAGRGPMLAG